MATNIEGGKGGLKTYATFTVSTAATGLSDIIALEGLSPRVIQMSTAWTNATITFMGSVTSTDAMTSVRYTTASAELAYTTTAARLLTLDPNYFAGLKYLQLRSGTTTTPVAQAAARTVYLGVTAVDNLN